MRRYLLTCLAAAVSLPGQDYVRVQSQADGKTYVIDTTKVGDDLKPVARAEGKLSSWLFPSPGAVPAASNYNVERRIASATFHVGGTPEQVVAYYVQLLRSQRLSVSDPLRSRAGGTQITGYNTAKTITVSVDPKPDYIEVRATEALKEQPSEGPKHFESVWYDDTRGILRLRDASTGDEYDLPKRSIVEHNLNRPGGAPSETDPMPDWLPVFPGARKSPKGKITWLFEPTAEFVTTTASIRQVYDYYRKVVEDSGAQITSAGITRTGRPPQDFSASIKALRGDDGIQIEIANVVYFNAALGQTTTAGPKKVGIGIRYTVPKR
jgi:hypothetical protein